MAESSVASLRELLGGVPEITDTRLQRVLVSAARKVKADGVSDTHDAFQDLQEYYAAGILEETGEVEGPLQSKSVADVSETYASSNSGGWLKLYIRELRTITGKRGFIV